MNYNDLQKSPTVWFPWEGDVLQGTITSILDIVVLPTMNLSLMVVEDSFGKAHVVSRNEYMKAFMKDNHIKSGDRIIIVYRGEDEELPYEMYNSPTS